MRRVCRWPARYPLRRIYRLQNRPTIPTSKSGQCACVDCILHMWHGVSKNECSSGGQNQITVVNIFAILFTKDPVPGPPACVNRKHASLMDGKAISLVGRNARLKIIRLTTKTSTARCARCEVCCAWCQKCCCLIFTMLLSLYREPYECCSAE